jgi:hypothetical protein
MMNSIAGALRRVLTFAVRRAENWREQRSQRRSTTTTTTTTRAPSHQAHADEATIRHMAEEQLGGISSEESRNAYLRGEHPGGLHHGGPGPEAVKRGDEDESTDLFDETRGAEYASRR